MPFKKPPEQPDFSSLIVSLDNSKLQQNNYALYQTIFFLVQNAIRSQDLTTASIDTINDDITAIYAASFLTVNNESNDFVNSRQLLAGTGVEFDDSILNERTINAVSGGGYAPMSTGAEPLEIMSDGAGSVLMVGFSE